MPFCLKVSTQFIYFAPICFLYIGGTLHDEIGGADSLSKMGANVEILSELVPTLGAGLNRTCSGPSAVRATGPVHVKMTKTW